MLNRFPNDMEKVCEYDPAIYPRKLWVSVGASTKELSEVFMGIEDVDDTAIAVTYETCRKEDNYAGVLVRFRNRTDITPSVIAHEATHAALSIYEYVGAEVDMKNQEPFAYLLGWIADCIWKTKLGK